MAMRVCGIDRLTPAEVAGELQNGGRFVFFEYCISLVVISLRQPTRVYFLKAGQTGLRRGLFYSGVSLLLGWWGIPWGVIYTPLTILTNLAGGWDVTPEVAARLGLPAPDTME
jgi:hypothetical protein